MSEAILEASGLVKRYREADGVLEVLSGAELKVMAGEQVAIIGHSGSGKTTLLNLLAGLDHPDEGGVRVKGQLLHELADRPIGELRNKHMGFVYQFHHLLAELTALENVMLPGAMIGGDIASARARALTLLERTGLGHRLDHRPAELSGGERQRVAISRALVNNPSLVFMDEPTGNLDQHTAANVQQLMRDIGHEYGTAFVVVTHDTQFADSLNRVLLLSEGRLVAGGVSA
jgi:lipoprotein-releasing system ATP-binding protein